jgi:hypothetical protein
MAIRGSPIVKPVIGQGVRLPAQAGMRYIFAETTASPVLGFLFVSAARRLRMMSVASIPQTGKDEPLPPIGNGVSEPYRRAISERYIRTHIGQDRERGQREAVRDARRKLPLPAE